MSVLQLLRLAVMAGSLGACVAMGAALAGSPAHAQEPAVGDATPPDAPFRLALPQMEGSGDCTPASDIGDPGAAAYARHLSSRFQRPVHLCLGGSTEASAQALAGGAVDVAWLDQDAYAAIADGHRAIMTLRPLDNIGRVPVVVFALDAMDPETARTGSTLLGYIDAAPEPLNVDRVFSVLGQWGLAQTAMDNAIGYGDFGELVTALRAGEIDVAATEVAVHFRACRVFDPSDVPCGDLKTLTTQRPAATEGFVVSRDMETEWRYRMIGVHVGMHLEAPDAFEWFSGGNALEFSPAEPAALIATGAEY